MSSWPQKPEPLPRGTCAVCEHNVALRRYGLVREHRAWPAEHGEPTSRRRLSEAPVCPGSGEPALETGRLALWEEPA